MFSVIKLDEKEVSPFELTLNQNFSLTSLIKIQSKIES